MYFNEDEYNRRQHAFNEALYKGMMHAWGLDDVVEADEKLKREEWGEQPQSSQSSNTEEKDASGRAKFEKDGWKKYTKDGKPDSYFNENTWRMAEKMDKAAHMHGFDNFLISDNQDSKKMVDAFIANANEEAKVYDSYYAERLAQCKDPQRRAALQRKFEHEERVKREDQRQADYNDSIDEIMGQMDDYDSLW